MGEQNLVGCVTCGRRISEKQTMRFEICKFAELDEARGTCILTDTIISHGYAWRIQLYPRGYTAHEQFSCYLLFVPDRPDQQVKTKLTIRMGSRNSHSCSHIFSKSNLFSGFTSNYRQSAALDVLDEYGTLIVEVDLQVDSPVKPPVWTPEKFKATSSLADLFGSRIGTDVHFCINGREMHAHSCVLALRAPTFYELSQNDNSSTEGENNSVVITGVDPTLFESMLRSVYVGNLPKEVLSTDYCHGEFLEAVNRFGCTDLKLELEAYIADRILNAQNAANWLVMADSHSCALLKEAAVNLFLLEAAAVMKSDGWANIRESPALLEEIVQAQHVKRIPKDENDFDNMDVLSLREKLQEHKESIDGSREMLVNRLKALKSLNLELATQLPILECKRAS